MNRAAQISLNLVRAPVLALLLVLEPIVRFICVSVMLLGTLAAIAFELSAAGPRFPFLSVLAASLGCGVVYFLYYSLIALFMTRF